MYAPHSVTVYNVCGEDGECCVTFLKGVFLDAGREISLGKNGSAGERGAVLYIPAGCLAENAVSGQVQQYCSPKEFDRMEDKSGVWTVRPGNAASGVDCFFVKGLAAAPEAGFAEIHDRFDGVYRVCSVDVRDFGGPNMRHLQVEGV